MAQLIDIVRVEVGLENLTARVRLSEDAPLMTSENLVGTTRVYNLMPHIIDHVCLGDAGETFKDAMGHTELAHLLEHMTVELLSQSSASGEVSCGRTRPADEERCFDIELSCPDDVLVIGALSSAVWIAEWAFGDGGAPEPDVEAIVAGLTSMVGGMGEGPAERYQRQIEDRFTEELRAEYQRHLQERQQQIAQREQEIEEARRQAIREAQERAAAERAAAEEEARLRAEAREAELAAERPGWAVDLEAYEAAEDARRQAEELASEQQAAERAALAVQETDEGETGVLGPLGGDTQAEVGEGEPGESLGSDLHELFSSRPELEAIQPEELEAMERGDGLGETAVMTLEDPVAGEELPSSPEEGEPRKMEKPEPAAEVPAEEDEEPELPWDEPPEQEAQAEHIPGPRRVR